MKPIVVVGSINADFVTRARRIPTPGETLAGDDFAVHFGGKGANQAVAVARLSYPVEMVGRVGSDSFGPMLRAALEQAGVGVFGVQAAPGPSGAAAITVTREGENAIVVVPGANSQLTPAYLAERVSQREALFAGAGMVLAQLEMPMETVEWLASLCRRLGVPLMLDPAPAAPLRPETLAAVSWLTPNESEARALLASGSELADAAPEEQARALLVRGPGAVALKLGERGALLLTRGGEPVAVPVPRVAAVDTTAAGDAWNGAFATALMLGMEPGPAGRFACAAAAISVTRNGAQPSLPTRGEVVGLLAGTTAGS